MRQRWKRRLCALLGTLFLLGSLWTIPAAAETAAPQTTAAESQSSDNAKDSGKTKQIVIVLVVFTVSCGATAFLAMQPSLKKLKAAKEQAKTVSAEQTKKDQ